MICKRVFWFLGKAIKIWYLKDSKVVCEALLMVQVLVGKPDVMMDFL